MQALNRRVFVLGSFALGASSLTPRRASATLSRGLPLDLLVGRSRHIVVLKPIDSHSHYVVLGGRRCIVTDTRVGVEESVAKGAPEQGELVVRTLGGRVGTVGEIVHGQAELEPGRVSLAFLKPGPDGAHWFVGMAQGHYVLEDFPAPDARLRASRNLPMLRDWYGSAARFLAGKRLDAARAAIVREAAK